MDKKTYMISKDSYLYKTILGYTRDIDKAYEIFITLHTQEFWTISQLEALL